MGLFSKLFGGKGSKSPEVNKLKEILDGTLDRAGLEIDYDVDAKTTDKGLEIAINFFGADEDLFTNKEGALLDAFQMFLKRGLQHSTPDNSVRLSCDCNGFREKSNQILVELADKLKNRALDQGKSVYLRALPPKDRKVVHQFLAEDDRVKSRSVGDGLYKKIKIYPNNKKSGESTTNA